MHIGNRQTVCFFHLHCINTTGGSSYMQSYITGSHMVQNASISSSVCHYLANSPGTSSRSVLSLFYITELSRCHRCTSPAPSCVSVAAASPWAVTSLGKSTTDGPAFRLTPQTQWSRTGKRYFPPNPPPPPQLAQLLRRQLAVRGRYSLTMWLIHCLDPAWFAKKGNSCHNIFAGQIL